MNSAAVTLRRRDPALASPQRQLELLRRGSERLAALEPFAARLECAGLAPLRAQGIEVLQVNVGKVCNQTCKHCHVDAGPERTEAMPREVFQACLRLLERTAIPTVDLTGGAPEMNPHFRWFVERARALGRAVIVRSNLTILSANARFAELPEFFRDQGVRVICSLPYYEAGFTDRQRGQGVFAKSVAALQRLNALGYGQAGGGLELDLVYNPAGAFLPADQAALEADYKRVLAARHGIVFNRLYTLANLPIARFLDYLQASGNLEDYLEKLVCAFNPAAAGAVMCRTLLSVGWDGRLYDCDFNQMLELPVEGGARIQDLDDPAALATRAIRGDQHCYGCTAGAGSS